MLVFLIRHGQSDNNKLNSTDSDAAYAYNRDPDPGLTEAGIAGGAFCGEYINEILRHLNYTGRVRILTSPMVRAIQSADILASFVKEIEEITIVPDIHEIGGLFNVKANGNVSGMTADEIREMPRINLGRRAVMPNRNTAEILKPGGWWNRERESYCQAHIRATNLWNRLKTEASYCPENQIVIVICHGLFLDSMWKVMLGSSSKLSVGVAKFAFVTHNWGLGVVKLSQQGAVTIQCINDCSHISLGNRLPHKIKNLHSTVF